MNPNQKRITIVTGSEIHTEVKKRAALSGISIRKWVMRAIMDKIKKEKKYESPIQDKQE